MTAEAAAAGGGGGGGEAFTPATTPARYERSCCLCHGAVQLGDPIFPVRLAQEDSAATNNVNRGLLWAHGACFHLLPDPASWRPPGCRGWARRGRCPMLEAGCCAFGHDEALRGTEGALQQQQRPDASSTSSSAAAAAAALAALGVPERKRRWGGRRNVVRNGHRNAAFRAFVQRTFGLELLRSGPVLDVAGGKGVLSWELLNCAGVSPCVVVDPRPLDTRYLSKKWRNGMYEPRRTGPVYCKWNPAVRDGDGRAKEPRDPPHLRAFFRASEVLRLVEEGADERAAEKWFEAQCKRVRTVTWTTKGLGEGHEEEEDGDGIDDGDEEEQRGEEEGKEKEVQREEQEEREKEQAFVAARTEEEEEEQGILEQHQQEDETENGKEDLGEILRDEEEEIRSAAVDKEGPEAEDRAPRDDDDEGRRGEQISCGDDEEDTPAATDGRGDGFVAGATEVGSSSEALGLLRSCVLVLGMHPDQGAGEAAEFAIARQLPWAVIPCCVYAREFPRRRLKDGSRVTKYEHLLQWLRELHPGTREVQLGFEGRNVCVYMTQEDYSTSAW